MDDSESTETESTDSRVTSFLRQAAGIIAGEKGMTPACHLKLQTLAEKIRLPQELFEKALRELESTDLDVEQLTRYEKAFVAFLDTEFEKIQGDVLSPRMENTAIEIASNKYQIEPIRAWKLIDSRCDSLGISRISPEEGRGYAKQSILACLGDRLFIDDDTQALLHRIGKDWGLDPLAVDHLMLSKVASNRNSQLKDRSSRVVPLTIVLIGVTLIGGLAIAFRPDLNIVQAPPSEKRSLDESESDGRNAGGGQSILPQGAIRDSRIRDYLEKTGEPNEFSTWLKSFAPADSETQSSTAPRVLRPAQALTWLLNRVAAGQGGAELDLFCEVYLNESDEAMAAQVRQSLATSLDRLTPTPERLLGIDQAISAHQVVQRIRVQSEDKRLSFSKAADGSVGRSLPSTRWKQLFQQLPVWYQQIGKGELSRDASEAAIANEQWSRFATFAFSNPELASRALPNLMKATEGQLPSELLSMYRDDVLFAIIESQPELASRLISIGLASIKESDEPTLNRWANALCADGVELDHSLAECFIKRAQLEPRSREDEDVRSAILEFRNLVRVRRYQPLMERVDRVSAISKMRLTLDVRSIEARQLPNRIADLMVAVNLELALCETMTMIDDRGNEAFETVDQWLVDANPNLLEAVSLVIDRDRSGARSGLQSDATASDYRTQESALAMLASEEDRVAFKVNSVRQLARVASRLSSPSYRESAQLVRFFLSDMPLKQRLELQQLMGSFSHWHLLSLALADQLEDSSIELDRVLTVARLLLRREFEIEDAEAWQSELRYKILLAVNDDLSDLVARDPSNENSDWTRLEFFMKDVYARRLKLLRSLNRMNSSTVGSFERQATVDGAALSDTAEAMLRSVRGGNRQRTSDFPVVNRFDYLVLINQLIIAEIGKEIQDGKAFTDQQVLFRERLRAAATVAQRYFETERRLLELLQRLRSEKVSKVTG